MTSWRDGRVDERKKKIKSNIQITNVVKQRFAGKCMSKHKVFLFLFVMVLIGQQCAAMVFDNRFIPLFQRPRIGIEGLASSFAIDFMIATASKAFDDDEQEIGIPELHGKFDLGVLANAIADTGKPNPLRSDLQGIRIPFKMDGRIQAQALTMHYRQQLINWLSLGCSWLFMRVNARQQFTFDKQNTSLILGPGDLQELDASRRRIFSDLGLIENHTAELGFGDIDAYLRFGKEWDYTLKCRRIDAGLSLGGLLATGVNHDINRPASIPFGGNGHWGFYVAADVLFELREDIKVGLLFRVNKRIPRTRNRRLSVRGEPRIFGAEVGQARVNPGATVIFSPYFVLENLRQGLGMGVHYTLTSHQEDDWNDRRENKEVPVKLAKVRDLSEWGSDYFTLNVFYDFGKVKVTRSFDPIFSFRWDVPAMIFISSRVAKTHKVSLGVEFAF